MRKLYVELRTPSGAATLSWDLVRHLYARQFPCPVIIVAENPNTFLAAVRKQWLKLARSVQSERARTLDAGMIFALTRGAAHMRELQFTLGLPEQAHGDVFLITPAELVDVPKNCRTLYITCALPDPEQLLHVAHRLSKHSLIVYYDKDAGTLFAAHLPK